MTELREHLARIQDLEQAAAILEWDQETYMPEGATGARARQLSTLQRVAHELFTGNETASLLEAAEPEDDIDRDLVRMARKDLDRAVRIPAKLVGEFAEATGLGREAWVRARSADDFSLFEPHLDRIVELCIAKAEAVGYEESPYDALLDEFEPGMRASEVSEVFGSLRKELVPMISDWSVSDNESVLRRDFPTGPQWDFGMRVMRDVGYDFTRGRQDVTAHPFTTTFSISDVRITTRIHENHFSPGFFGSMHEMGHGLYEQGVDPELEGTLLADGTSLGMHESQSRLWENLVCRARPFWVHYYPALQEAFPQAVGGVPADEFYRAVNRVSPSIIRIEADEVTYNLHIMVRFELEMDLIAGRLKPSDVPAAWNDRMEEFLGVRPASDADGCLQDIHWSMGILGYFPTYALGNLMSAQLWNAILRDVPGVEGHISRGEFSPLLAWLRERIHHHGRRRSADEILRAATGSSLDAGPWLDYARNKFGGLAGS